MKRRHPTCARFVMVCAAALAGLWLCACEVITVDPHETDLTGPYIPIVSPLGHKTGEVQPTDPREEQARRRDHFDRARQERGEKFLNRVQELIDRNDCAAAEPMLKKHISRARPTHKARAVYYLALCYQRAGAIDAAISLLQENLAELTPTTPFGIEQLRLIVELQKQKRGEKIENGER